MHALIRSYIHEFLIKPAFPLRFTIITLRTGRKQIESYRHTARGVYIRFNISVAIYSSQSHLPLMVSIRNLLEYSGETLMGVTGPHLLIYN